MTTTRFLTKSAEEKSGAVSEKIKVLKDNTKEDILEDFNDSPNGLLNEYTTSLGTRVEKYKWEIVWSSTLILIALHVGGIYGYWCMKPFASSKTLWFSKTIAILGSLGITAGAHRLWCHRAYKANAICQIILMWMITLTYQKSTYHWCRDHRVHHKYSETDADPYNARRGFFFSHMGWLFLKKHRDVTEKGKEIDLRDLEANPIVMFQHKYYYILVFVNAVVLPISIMYFCFGQSLGVCIFYGTMWRYLASVHITWSINSFAHLFGNKPYNKEINPTECPPLMYLGMGEGFHNYHHTFPWDYKAAEFGGDMKNTTTMLIDFFAKLGWVTDRRSVPVDVIQDTSNKKGDETRLNYVPTFIKNVKEILPLVFYIYMI